MSSAKLMEINSTHKNNLCFYTLVINNPKRRFKKPFNLQQHQKEKYLRINLAKVQGIYTKYC